MDSFLPFLLATVVGSVVAGVSYLVARRAGLGPVQAEYVRNLEGNNRMLDQRLDEIEAALGRERATRAKLAKRVIRLERLVVTLSDENAGLRKRLNMPVRIASIDLAEDDDAELTDEDGST